MIISGYGIRLHRLQKEEDIELLRKWRNSSHIHQFMEFREQISKEQQTEWFQSINNVNNNYMIIEYEGKNIGMIHGAGINWDKKSTASGGIFIWDKNYLLTKAPASTSILMTDMSSFLGLEKTFVKILKSNKNAIAFNTFLGYELLPNQEGKCGQEYVLKQDVYQIKRERIIQTMLPELKTSEIAFYFNSNNVIDLFYYEKMRKVKDKFQLKIYLDEKDK